MVGETVDERIVKLDKMLDEFSEKTGVKFIKPNTVDIITNQSQEDIRGLSEEDCLEQSYMLYRHAGYVQKESNRLDARIRWLKRCIEIETADKIKTYGDKYTSFQERTILLNGDKTNPYMSKLQDLLMHCEIRKEELSFISSRVSAMASLLENAKRIKGRQKWEQ